MATITNINNGVSWQDAEGTWATTNTWASYADSVVITNIT